MSSQLCNEQPKRKTYITTVDVEKQKNNDKPTKLVENCKLKSFDNANLKVQCCGIMLYYLYTKHSENVFKP